MLTEWWRYRKGLAGWVGGLRHSQPSSKTAVLGKGMARWRQERSEGKQGTEDSPGLALPELVLERGGQGGGQCSWMPLSVQSPEPPGVGRSGHLGLPPTKSHHGQGEGAMLPGSPVSGTDVLGTGALLFHHLHLRSSWKVGPLWLPTPGQLHPRHSHGPAPAPP